MTNDDERQLGRKMYLALTTGDPRKLAVEAQFGAGMFVVDILRQVLTPEEFEALRARALIERGD